MKSIIPAPPTIATRAIRTIAVDLTPVLPGGENGGAKVFALELVRQLAAQRPDIRLILLTQAASHEELVSLDAPNVERRLVIGPAVAQGRAGIHATGLRVLSRLPQAARQGLSRLAFAAYERLRRANAGRLLAELGAELLFCPFTAPSYHDGRITTVCTLHDVQHRVYPQFFGVEDAVQRDRAFLAACRRATRIAADSDDARESAMRIAAVEAERIRTIAIRIPPAAPSVMDAEAVLRRFGVQRGRYFIYPANFWKHKNHEMLLVAFALARRDGLADDIRIVCTGAPGARSTQLAAAAGAMGLASRVSFPGFVEAHELDALLRHAMALVFPSLYEGYGLPVVEAMSRGVPVACSNVTSLPEVAGDAALLFDPRKPEAIAEAMTRLAGDASLRARLAEAGRIRAQPLTDAARMGREYWALFEEAAAA